MHLTIYRTSDNVPRTASSALVYTPLNRLVCADSESGARSCVYLLQKGNLGRKRPPGGRVTPSAPSTAAPRRARRDRTQHSRCKLATGRIGRGATLCIQYTSWSWRGRSPWSREPLPASASPTARNYSSKALRYVHHTGTRYTTLHRSTTEQFSHRFNVCWMKISLNLNGRISMHVRLQNIKKIT